MRHTAKETTVNRALQVRIQFVYMIFSIDAKGHFSFPRHLFH